jgi:hypothetical protein
VTTPPKPITLPALLAELQELDVPHALVTADEEGHRTVQWAIGGKIQVGMRVDLAAGVGHYLAEVDDFRQRRRLAMMLPLAEPWAWERLGWLLSSTQAAVGREGWGRHRDRDASDVRPVPIPLVPEAQSHRVPVRIRDFRITTIT